MSNRKLRVGELMKREISDILRTRFQDRSALITITECDVAPDNSNAKVYFSVVETEPDSVRQAQRFLAANNGLIKRELSRRIVIKRMPALHFMRDEVVHRGARIEALLDSLEIPDEAEDADPDDSPEEDAER